MSVFVSIGNSDDGLTQQEWARFYQSVDQLIEAYSSTIYGRWVSGSTSVYQNACWAFEPTDEFDRYHLRRRLREKASGYRQESIAWVEGEADMLRPNEEDPRPAPANEKMDASA